VLLRSSFMASYTGPILDGGIASSRSALYATQTLPSPTVRRRMQRKHSQISYRLMKAKLLAIVRPLPSQAIQAADLEAFRTSIYVIDTAKKDAEEPTEMLASAGNSVCSWCGIWQPLPIAPICSQQVAKEEHGALGNQPTVARFDAVAAESDPDYTTPGELGNQPTVATEVAVAAVPDPWTSRTPHASLGRNVLSAERGSGIGLDGFKLTPAFEPLQASFLVQTKMRRYSFKRQPQPGPAAAAIPAECPQQ
jgi:hypothetical protein